MDGRDHTARSLAERRGRTYDYYEAAEDSAVLAGAVAEDLEETSTELVLDVGTGSGYVGARIAEATGARVVGVDVNPAACRQARTAGVETILGDLVEPFADGVFDVVTFNPPYLPAAIEAEWDDWFEIAVTGGETGRELIDRFVDRVGRVLSEEGAAYLLLSSYTGVEAVVERAADRGFNAMALADATFPGETLTALKLHR